MQNIYRCAVFNVYNDKKILFKHRVNHRLVVNASDFQSKVSSSNLLRDLNLSISICLCSYIANNTTVLIFPNNTN